MPLSDRLYPDFKHVDTWVFDLDNTLYAPGVRLFDQIEEKMRSYITRHLGVDLATADALRARYWAEYGTTLAGLMAHHDTDPMHFLEDVHDIDFTPLSPAPDLAAAIAALPGRKLIYTNGDAAYARRVLAARGLGELFEGVFGIEHANFRPKPAREAYEMIFGAARVPHESAAMFEDDIRNLEVPHAMGLRTVLVNTASDPLAHIDHHTNDLPAFLSQITAQTLPTDA